MTTIFKIHKFYSEGPLLLDALGTKNQATPLIVRHSFFWIGGIDSEMRHEGRTRSPDCIYCRHFTHKAAFSTDSAYLPQSLHKHVSFI
jgi:hypothetical protein